MSNRGEGYTLGVTDRPQSRRQVEVSTGYGTSTRVTLLPGVLGTDDGAEVLRRASDLQSLVYQEPRRSARDDRKG